MVLLGTSRKRVVFRDEDTLSWNPLRYTLVGKRLTRGKGQQGPRSLSLTGVFKLPVQW